MEVGESMELDHQPITVAIQTGGFGRKKKRMDMKDRRKNKRGIWNETGRNKFREMIRGIGMKEWKEHVMGLLEGVEIRIVRDEGKEEETPARDEGEREIGEKEIKNVICKLKDGKAIGGDGVPNEA
ncbi:hypothetical protein PV325_000269 [Microctonus aethiopoides]|nr:hypothetical protein PV325_000269 [Microctonus aethiopoides]